MKKLLIAYCLFIFLFSCEKKHDSEIINIPFKLTIGDTLNRSLAITPINRSMATIRDTVNLDLDNDHNVDVQFQTLYSVTFGGMLLDFSLLNCQILNSNLKILMTSDAGDASFHDSFYAKSLDYGTIVKNDSPYWRSGTSLLYEVYMKSYTYPPMVAYYDTVGYWYDAKNRYLAFELNGQPGWIKLNMQGYSPFILETAILNTGK